MKKKNLRVLLCLLTVIMMISLAACGGGNTAAETTTEEVSTKETTTAEETTTAAETTTEEATSEKETETSSETAEETTPAQTEAVEAQEEVQAASWKDNFEQSGSLYFCTRTSGTPVQGGGLEVIVDTSEGSVTYIIVDTAGNETVEYLYMNYSSGQVERYQYVSAMGQGFYYYCDLNGNNLSVFNTDGEDRTAGAQDAGHYDSAVESTGAMISSYTAYFSSAFGISAQDAALDY